MKTTTDVDVYALTQLVEGNPVATIVIDAQHRVTHWNRACAVLTGVSAAEMIGKSEQWRAFYDAPRPILADLVVDQAADDLVTSYYDGKFSRSALIEDACEAEDFFPSFGANGRWLFFTAAAIRNAAGEIVGAIETLQDVTERHQSASALRDSEAYLAQIADGSSVATLVIDAAHRVTHWNRACEALTGTLAQTVIGTSDQWKAFYPSKRSILADLVLDNAAENVIDRLYHGRFRPSKLIAGAFEAEDFFPHFGEEGRWLFFTAAPICNAVGQTVGAIETLQDVTERRRAEEALRESEERYRRLSLTDSLTGLFNARHLHERLRAEIERAHRYGRALSMLVIDCDHFKRINDQFGHLDGDKVLQALAGVIEHCMRRSDSAYRYGGEEFIVLLPETHGRPAFLLAERLRGAFENSEVRAADGQTIRCTVSIGVAESNERDSANSLMRRADDAAYKAKDLGRNQVVLAE